MTYAHDELAELLSSGGDIECYCVSCDVHWSVPPDERADIARGLARSR